jgi:hypothetical protein
MPGRGVTCIYTKFRVSSLEKNRAGDLMTGALLFGGLTILLVALLLFGHIFADAAPGTLRGVPLKALSFIML